MPETVPATLQYLANDPKYDTEKPYQILINLSHVPGSQRSNHKYETVSGVPIIDVRTCDGLPTLDEHGFQLEQLPNMIYPTDFDNKEWVTGEYYSYIQDFLKDLLQAKEVIIFEHQVRQKVPGCSGTLLADISQLRYRQPGFGIGEAAKSHPAPREGYAPPVPVVHSGKTYFRTLEIHLQFCTDHPRPVKAGCASPFSSSLAQFYRGNVEGSVANHQVRCCLLLDLSADLLLAYGYRSMKSSKNGL